MSGLHRYSNEEKCAMLYLCKSYRQIFATLTGHTGIKMTASGVRKFILRYKLSGSSASTGYRRKFPKARKLSLQALAVHRYIDSDREISAPQLQKKLLNDFGICPGLPVCYNHQ